MREEKEGKNFVYLAILRVTGDGDGSADGGGGGRRFVLLKGKGGSEGISLNWALCVRGSLTRRTL